MKKLTFKLMTMALAAGAMAFDAVAEGGLLPNWRQETENLHFKVEVRNALTPVAASADRLAVAEARLREIAGEKAVISLAREFVGGDELDLVPMDVERDQAIPKPFETVLVGFIDDCPERNWAHPCRYVLFNGDLSECVIVRHLMPPMRVFTEASGRDNRELRQIGSRYLMRSTDETIKKVRETVESMKTAKAVNKSVMAANAVEPTMTVKPEQPENSYFLVISGGVNPDNNGIRFWSDAAIYYSTLRITYEVPKENIVLLVSDGGAVTADATLRVYDADGSDPYVTYVSSPTDLDGDGIGDVTGPANRESVRNALAAFAEKLKPTDQLTVFITSHGSSVGDPSPDNHRCAAWLFSLNPNKQEYILDSELAKMTKDIPCPVGFVIETCYSGGFIDDIMGSAGEKAERVIATACRHDQNSWGVELYNYIGDVEDFRGMTLAFNTWAMTFSSAVRGCYPATLETAGSYPWYSNLFSNYYCSQADKNGDGRISFAEAFDYSRKCDFRADPDGEMYEEPQLAQSVAGLSLRFFTVKQTSTAPVLPTLNETQLEQVSWGLQLSRVGKSVDRDDYEYACRYYGVEPKAEPQVVKDGELAVSKQALQAAKVGTLAVKSGVVSLGVNLCGTSDITAAAPDWTKLDLGKATFGLSEDGRELVIKLPVNTDSGFMTLFTKDSRLEQGETGASGSLFEMPK